MQERHGKSSLVGMPLNVQWGVFVLQPAGTHFQQQIEKKRKKKKLSERLSKKQAISDKLQQYSQNPADLQIESWEVLESEKENPQQSIFFFFFLVSHLF